MVTSGSADPALRHALWCLIQSSGAEEDEGEEEEDGATADVCATHNQPLTVYCSKPCEVTGLHIG